MSSQLNKILKIDVVAAGKNTGFPKQMQCRAGDKGGAYHVQPAGMPKDDADTSSSLLVLLREEDS